MPLAAEILTEQLIGDQRSAVRRSLRLGVSANSSGNVAMALILNLSETGLLIESVVKLEVGEILYVNLPEACGAKARVAWTEDLLAGCAFLDPISPAAVSASQLKSSMGSRATKYPSWVRADVPSAVDRLDHEAALQRVIVLAISAAISVAAVIIFLAAILKL